MPPSDCTVVGGMDMGSAPKVDVWVGVGESGGAAVVSAAASVVASNGLVASCRLARLAENFRIRILLI